MSRDQSYNLAVSVIKLKKIRLFEPSHEKDKFHILHVMQVVLLWICFMFFEHMHSEQFQDC